MKILKNGFFQFGGGGTLSYKKHNFALIRKDQLQIYENGELVESDENSINVVIYEGNTYIKALALGLDATIEGGTLIIKSAN